MRQDRQYVSRQNIADTDVGIYRRLGNIWSGGTAWEGRCLGLPVVVGEHSIASIR